MSGQVAVRADLEGVQPYGAPQLDVAVRLNTNETPYPPPPKFIERFAARLAQLPLQRYPDRQAWELRVALSERFGLSPEQVWPANGSNEVLVQLFSTYGGPDRRLLLFQPGYSAYPLLARAACTPVVSAQLDEGFRLTDDIAAAALAAHNPHVICVASPNNPTGISVSAAAVRALHDRSEALVVVDEAYAEFAGHTALDLLAQLPRLVVVRTFSKAFRLAGIRLGYALARPWVVEDVQRVRLPYHLDAPTQAAGVVACELAEDVMAHIPEIVAERERVRAALEDLDLQVWPSEGNFLLFRSPIPPGSLFDRLLERGVLIRDFSRAPRLAGCLRVTVGTPDENDRFLAALQEVIV